MGQINRSQFSEEPSSSKRRPTRTMSHTRLSRRQFIVSSVATGVAGIIARHAKPAAATPFSIDGQDRLVTIEAIGDREPGYGANTLFQGQRVARRNRGGEFCP